MTDKVQKIREEVERLKRWNNNVRNSTRHMTLQEEDFNRGKHSSYLEILNFIDSLQEEPKQKFKIGDRIKFKGIYDEDVVRTITDIQKYDDGSCKYIFADGNLHSVGNNEIIDDTLNLSNVQKNCKEFEEPVSEDLEEAAYHNCIDRLSKESIEDFKAGAKWQKEQIMKNATDVTVHIEAGNYPYIPQMELYDYDNDVPLAKEGDKYKVVLIKEE